MEEYTIKELQQDIATVANARTSRSYNIPQDIYWN